MRVLTAHERVAATSTQFAGGNTKYFSTELIMPYCSSYAQMRCVNKVVKNGNFVKILATFMHCQIFLSRVDINGNHYCSLLVETEFVIHPLVC